MPFFTNEGKVDGRGERPPWRSTDEGCHHGKHGTGRGGARAPPRGAWGRGRAYRAGWRRRGRRRLGAGRGLGPRGRLRGLRGRHPPERRLGRGGPLDARPQSRAALQPHRHHAPARRAPGFARPEAAPPRRRLGGGLLRRPRGRDAYRRVIPGRGLPRGHDGGLGGGGGEGERGRHPHGDGPLRRGVRQRGAGLQTAHVALPPRCRRQTRERAAVDALDHAR